MLRAVKVWMMILLLALIVTTPAYARTISLKDAGVALWIFVIIGAVIVLMQLIPAAILFFSFVATTSTAMLKNRKAEDAVDEKTVATGYAPVSAKD